MFAALFGEAGWVPEEGGGPECNVSFPTVYVSVL